MCFGLFWVGIQGMNRLQQRTNNKLMSQHTGPLLAAPNLPKLQLGGARGTAGIVATDFGHREPPHHGHVCFASLEMLRQQIPVTNDLKPWLKR